MGEKNILSNKYKYNFNIFLFDNWLFKLES